MKNARFNVWAGCDPDIVITLKPGQALSRETGGPTDEGWASYWVRWHYSEDGYIYREQATDGTDCDGRMSTHNEDRCHRGLLRANRWTDSDGTRHASPRWVPISSGQRDYSAEAAGY